MSFLNPVNEPVLRFKSTDAGAPQINYNARVAGDVKAVLKACLVTGYGAVASAGWSVVNEVNHVAEFVSPSVAMSDYRLGIDDGSESTTTWYYQYQNARVNPSYNNPTKSFTFADKANANNGWHMFVTERGIIFIELVRHSAVSKLSGRITYWGQCKSALIDDAGKNMMFFNVGHNAAINVPASFYSKTEVHTSIGVHTVVDMSAATGYMLAANTYSVDTSVADLVSPIYLAANNKSLMLGELPPMLSKVVNATADIYGVSESALDARNVMSVAAGFIHPTASTAISYARTFLIRTDYWEY